MFLKRHTLDIDKYLRAEDAPALERRTIHDESALPWEGRIVARAWPADMPAVELRLMRVGGSRRRLARPDYGEPDDPRPVYILSDAEAREARRLLDSYTLGGIEAKNLITNSGRNILLNFLTFPTVGANTGYTGIVAFAVGTVSGTTSASDTALFGGGEVFRKQIGLTTISGNTVDLTTDFNSGEGNYTYADAGLFASSPTSVASPTVVKTGVLAAHALYQYTKTSTVILANDYYVTLG